jgi:alpha-glucosidase
MRAILTGFVFLLSALGAARAQDERHVVSPSGQFEFHLFVVAEPEGGLWPRLAYQVLYRGKLLISPSLMGMDLLNQEPFLGENPGFMSSTSASNVSGHYNLLVAHYMQNGSLGRRLDVEVRAYDDGVAFRYLIPKSTPIEEILIRDEATEFNFAPPGALTGLPKKPDFDLPFVIEQPGVGWVAISEAGKSVGNVNYPRTYLVRSRTNGMITNLGRSPSDPVVAFAGNTPLMWRWRVVMAGSEREHLEKSPMVLDLER